MKELDGTRAKWEDARGKERTALCRELQVIIFDIRPKDSVLDSEFSLGETRSVSSVIGFLKVVNIMKGKLDLEEREGYTQEDHESWLLTINSICTLIKMGLPVGMGLFSDKVTKPGAKEPRNRNSKISSYLQHLKVKRLDVYEDYTSRITSVVEERRGARDDGDSGSVREATLNEYIKGMEFDASKVTESDEDDDRAGLFTGIGCCWQPIT